MFKSFRRSTILQLRSAFCASTLIVLFLSGCGRELPVFENIDLNQWQKDRNACGTYRIENFTTFQSQKDKLLALKEMQVVNLLGRPDRNELYKRNQKFYYYYLKPAPECPNYNAGDIIRLAIRFNAMGLAKEVIIE